MARSGSTIRFRYTGTSTQVSEVVDNGAGTSQLKVGNGWNGERLATWTGSSSNPRYHGTNGHGDMTWLADGTGAVVATLRYDPWGNVAAASGAVLPDWRFQSSWNDTATGSSWVVTRWYAPGLGRFVSEDSLLGEPDSPDSRHLYAYVNGSPVAGFDPDGRVALSFANSTAFKVDGQGDGKVWPYSGILTAKTHTASLVTDEKNWIRGGINSQQFTHSGPNGSAVYRVIFDWESTLEANVLGAGSAFASVAISAYLYRVSTGAQLWRVPLEEEYHQKVWLFPAPVPDETGTGAPGGKVNQVISFKSASIKHGQKYYVQIRLRVYTKTEGAANATAWAQVSEMSGIAR